MNEKRIAIHEAQEYLRKAARLYEGMPQIIPDGIYSMETEQAVQDFQKRTDLPVTGKIDFETWNMLVRKSKESDDIFGQPLLVAPITNSDLPLKIGDTGNLVITAQQMLQYIAQRFSNIPLIKQDGIYSQDMADAVSRWQWVCRLPEKGIIDKITWDRLAQFFTAKL